MWKWNTDGKVITCEANMARDRHMFRVPPEGLPATERLHSGERVDVVTWQWPGDERVFLIPTEICHYMAAHGGLIRDVIAMAGQLYRDQHYPSDLKTHSSLRRIADGVGLSWNSRVADDLDDCLGFARLYTIRHQEIVTALNKNGTVKSTEIKTFGFINSVSRPGIVDGKRVPKNKALYTIELSDIYATTLRTLPAAPLPVAALEVAHSAPRRVAPTIKNLAYHLSARVPQSKIRLLLPTIREIAGLAERKDGRIDKTKRAIENALERLRPVMVSDFNFVEDGYTIILAGHLMKNKNT
jgi:hypothetical protein